MKNNVYLLPFTIVIWSWIIFKYYALHSVVQVYMKHNDNLLPLFQNFVKDWVKHNVYLLPFTTQLLAGLSSCITLLKYCRNLHEKQWLPFTFYIVPCKSSPETQCLPFTIMLCRWSVLICYALFTVLQVCMENFTFYIYNSL